MPKPTKFGQELRTEREALNLSMVALSELTKPHHPKGVHENTIWGIENGRSPGSPAIRRVLNHVLSLERKNKSEGGLSLNSLSSFIKESRMLQRIEFAVSHSKDPEWGIAFSEDWTAFFLKRLKLLEISTLAALEELLQEREAHLKKFIIRWFNDPINVLTFVPRGISISFLSNIVVFEQKGVEGLEAFLKDHRFSPTRDPKKLAQTTKLIHEEIGAKAKGSRKYQ